MSDENRTEVWTKVNAEGERVYIGVVLDPGNHVIAATNAYGSAAETSAAMRLHGEQARWVQLNRDGFEVVR